VQQSQAALEQAQVNVAYTSITSPVDGVVVSRNVDVGQTVAASLSAPTLFIIANDLSRMQVHASVDEADIGNISQAASVGFTVDAYPNRNFSGTIGEIRLEPQSVQNVVTYTVIINVGNERLELKPGMTANISITVAERSDALKVPNTALRYLPPGKTREDVTAMLRNPGAETASLKPVAGLPDNSRAAPASEPDGARMSPQPRAGDAALGRRDGRGGFRRADPAAALSPRPAVDAELAPGQMWDTSGKIQFPKPGENGARPGIIWVLDSSRQPEPRRVMLGITDGTATELISGELREGDQVIVGDTAEASGAARPGQDPQRPGGGRGFMFGGPR
jgi:HlyD family secretion protein